MNYSMTTRRFLDTLQPIYHSYQEYRLQVLDRNLAQNDREDEGKFGEQCEPTFQQCSFCENVYSTDIDLASCVGFYLHTDCTCSALFIPKCPGESVLLTDNTADQICRFCYEELKNIAIPQVLRSFRVTIHELDQSLPVELPLDLVDIILRYANSLYNQTAVSNKLL